MLTFTSRQRGQSTSLVLEPLGSGPGAHPFSRPSFLKAQDESSRMLSRTLRKGGSTGARHEASVGITSVVATTPKPSPTEPPSCRPAPMPSSAFAPTTAPSRTVVGPFVTAFGFRSWYWVCVPDAIIAVPQGFWTGAALANSDSSGRRVRIPLFLVALMVKLISGPGRVSGSRSQPG